ncbi:hypothetical protein BaRGS_00033724 [Batillaria attramentaria]|uniref:Uncharacterized protein n=1 Tax=Batillaria attramentaria TaxID=370345 RepID=A0ABD0JJ82_9CAEN
MLQRLSDLPVSLQIASSRFDGRSASVVCPESCITPTWSVPRLMKNAKLSLCDPIKKLKSAGRVRQRRFKYLSLCHFLGDLSQQLGEGMGKHQVGQDKKGGDKTMEAEISAGSVP